MCSSTNYGKKRYSLDTLYIFLTLGVLRAISHFQISHKRTKITIVVSESANEISKVSVASAWNTLASHGYISKEFQSGFRGRKRLAVGALAST